MATIPASRRPSRAQPGRRANAPQIIVAVALLAGSAALLFTQDWSRRLEAGIAEHAIGALLGVGSELAPTGTFLTVGAGSDTIFTLDVSFACSVVLLLIPLMVTAAALLATGRASLIRTIPTLLVGAALLLAVNASRFVLIAAMTLNDGLDGYGWAHTVYGSMIVLVALALILTGFVRIVSAHNTEKSKRDRS